ncbi:hypothetical protein CK203_066043 [Vitis vinifera]|uniref:G-patch domain-containing protein n=1 Tax=Vitis vinifera TaxID=29760 RepID=A0A438FNH5_VITVI|nr:hypothetical protein CK203_066043 [Vitis vinifera]
MSFDQHGSTVVLDIMRSMSYLPGMGLGRRQHGPSEFIAIPDHDVPFGLGFTPLRPIISIWRACARREASEPLTRADVIIGGLSTTQEVELQRLVQQLRLETEPLTDEHGTFDEVGDVVDGAAPHDEYIDEMLALSMSQIEETIQPGLASSFDLFGGASDFVDPPLSFDVLSGFVSRSDIVSDVSSMDLSIFEYLPVSCDIDLSAPSSPTSQIFDIDDEIAQHDSDDDSSSVSDSDPVDQRVSPAVGDTEIVDLARRSA